MRASAPLAEQEVSAPVPRLELAEWQTRYGVVAGITTRGSPEAPFDLGLWTGAPVGEVMSRWRAFRGSQSGFGVCVLGNQVHGAEVAVHRQLPARPRAGRPAAWHYLEGIDGHATVDRGVLLSVSVADCIPVYLVAPEQGALALLHAGWRGAAAGILGRGIEALRELAGSKPSDLVIHCGVGICGRCYEVGSEVMDGLGLPARGAGPWHVDLREVLTGQARAAGVTEISTSSWCSAHHRERFFSHRASGGRDGRMVAYLGLPRIDIPVHGD